ncbi:MAG: RNA polymerase sigma-70 factor [Sphingobacteriaceae bacterium]
MIDYSALSDLELLVLVKNDDRLAFDQIYNRFNGLLYIYAVKVTKDKEEARDIVQEIFISLWDKRESLQLNSSLSSYLYSAVRYKFFDLVSRNKVRSDYAASFQSFIDLGTYSTDNYINEKELIELVEREVGNLPDKMREVFQLSRNAGLSHKEIAEQLNISEKTVRNHVNHALKILRLKLGITALAVLFFYS